jgi:hypothetical protein
MPRRRSASPPSSSTVSVFRPRKSNFTSPASSTFFMLNCVTGMSERGSRYIGTSSVERPVADDDAGGVGRGVAVEAFELLGDVKQGLDDRLLLDLLGKARLALDRLRRA